MDKLITVRDMMNRYGCSGPTARKYMRQMYHYENPLTAPEWALTEWERSREAVPADPRRQIEILHRRDTGRVIVPRKRGA
jgi:hypothetical protein